MHPENVSCVFGVLFLCQEKGDYIMKIILKDGSIQEAAFEQQLGRKAFHHTTAHVLAQAVKRLYPNTKCAIGPAVKDGFYYDFSFDFDFSAERFEEIEKEMQKIVKENLPLKHFTLDRESARRLIEKKAEPLKLELLQELPPQENLSFYQQGEYLELCAGPHLSGTGEVKAFKLLSTAGAYLRGDEKNQMLTRIYGISFPDRQQLEAYLAQVEEAKKRDHRKLGQELGLFTLFEAGPGFPFFLPKGMILKNLLIEYWRNLHTREHLNLVLNIV